MTCAQRPRSGACDGIHIPDRHLVGKALNVVYLDLTTIADDGSQLVLMCWDLTRLNKTADDKPNPFHPRLAADKVSLGASAVSASSSTMQRLTDNRPCLLNVLHM
jgi:hypothetical protein